MRWLSNYNLKVFEKSWFSEMIFYGVIWLVKGKMRGIGKRSVWTKYFDNSLLKI